jgi:hypothetical protein
MSSTTIAPAVATGPAVTPWRRRLASGLLAVAAISALGSAAVDIAGLATADPELKVLEAWRAYGLVVFAGLFILLALRPRAMRGVWELAIFDKAALTLTAAAWLSAEPPVTGATAVVAIDGALTVLLVAAYLLTRAWTAWRPGDGAAEALRGDAPCHR